MMCGIVKINKLEHSWHVFLRVNSIEALKLVDILDLEYRNNSSGENHMVGQLAH